MPPLLPSTPEICSTDGGSSGQHRRCWGRPPKQRPASTAAAFGVWRQREALTSWRPCCCSARDESDHRRRSTAGVRNSNPRGSGKLELPGGRTTSQMNRSRWSYPRSPYPTKTTLKRKATYTSPYTCRTPTYDVVHHTTLHRWSDTCLGVLLYVRKQRSLLTGRPST